jgi:hypothetical protein
MFLGKDKIFMRKGKIFLSNDKDIKSHNSRSIKINGNYLVVLN